MILEDSGAIVPLLLLETLESVKKGVKPRVATEEVGGPDHTRENSKSLMEKKKIFKKPHRVKLVVER